MKRTQYSISTILCCYNSAARIKGVLGSLESQELPTGWHADVVLIDNASTDCTAELARTTWRRNDMPLRIVTEPRQGLSCARATGLRASNSAIVCFVDDDNFLAPDYLKVAVEMMQDYQDAAACGGHGKPSAETTIPSWMWQGWRSHAVGPQGDMRGYVPDSRGFVYGAGLVLRKVAYEQLMGLGFHSLLSDRRGKELSSGGDVELCLALRMLGWKLIYSPDLQFEHLMPASRLHWDYCLKLFYNYGQANAVLGFYSAWLDPSPWSRRFRRSWAGTLAYCFCQEMRGSKCRRKVLSRPEGCPEALRDQELLGRADALRGFRAGGHLKKLYQQLQALRLRCRAARVGDITNGR